MKGYIAFCPHFHQPHFQLHKTREEAYENSYLPWLDLLNKATELENFFINLHYSGPLLYWFKDQKKEYIKKLQDLHKTGKVGILGGLIDEPFVQLSSRSDDYLYQLRKYEEIIDEIFKVKADKWQGIHLVERECGEILLHEVSKAAELIKAPPLYYLDAETFYESYFSYPGGERDYCLKHFNFVDPVAGTTIPHFPQEMLYYAFRDEIAGTPYYAVPIHSQFRYKLLKRQAFTPEDKNKVKPHHYLFYIKDAIEKAAEMGKYFGREIKPIVLIFEDAEKLGQWSKDPAGDVKWMLDFFRLVEDDPDLSFIGLKDYYAEQGYFDTYPVSCSHSYPEWENWTAKRGIRGVNFVDERLRRVLCRLRVFEEKQEMFEKQILKHIQEKMEFPSSIKDSINRAIFQSLERYDMIEGMLKEYQPEYYDRYQLINRVRNVLYQEDPKWASRHPSYGSSPYYDVTGLAYLELSEKILDEMISKSRSRDNNLSLEVCSKKLKYQIKDWDFDGIDEVLIQSNIQSLVIDLEGACVTYHHAIKENFSQEQLIKMVDNDLTDVKAYNSIYRYSYPFIFTETDSTLKKEFYPEGGRKEVCRNSMRCEVHLKRDGYCYKIGDFAQKTYNLNEVIENKNSIAVVMSCSEEIRLGFSNPINIEVKKTITVKEASINYYVELKLDPAIEEGEIYLVPELVSSAAASDEVNFKPRARMAYKYQVGDTITYKVNDQVEQNESGFTYKDQEFTNQAPQHIDYYFQVHSGDGSSFQNALYFDFKQIENLSEVQLWPAVQHYYENMVFPGQSRLGYYTSGIMLKTPILLKDKQVKFECEISWGFDIEEKNIYDDIIDLIKAEER